MWSWLGLRFRLVLLVLLALLPVFALFAYSAAKNQQATVMQAQASLQAQALLAAAHQQRLVDRTAQLLSDMASGPSIKDTRNRLCEQYLTNLLAQDPAYGNLGVLGLNGKSTCHAGDNSAHVDAATQLFFRQVLAGQSFSVGSYGVGHVSQQPAIAFGKPVVDSTGALNGVAFAALTLKAVASALMTDQVLSPGSQLRVMDRRGMVLAAYPAGDRQAGQPEPDAVVLAAALTGQQGARTAQDASGINRLYAYAPVGGAANGDLFVALSVPCSILTAGPRALLWIDLAALLGTAAFGMACAWVMGQRLIVQPARAILTGANAVGQGHLETRIKLGRLNCDEIGHIGLAFNRMADSLQAQRSQLDSALRQTDKERSLLDLILNSMSEGVIAVDMAGEFLLFNATASKLCSIPQGGESFDAWRCRHPLHTLDGKPLEDQHGPLTQALHGASFHNQDLMFCKPGMPAQILRTNSRPLLDADHQTLGALVVFTDITELKAAERFALAQEQVLALMAGGASLAHSLEAIVKLIETSSPASLCSILLVNGQQLRHGAAPSLPHAFVQAIDGLSIADGVGACGTAAFRKEPVVVQNTASDPLVKNFRDLLLTHGLRACWSTPVLSSAGETLATFAIYRLSPCAPTAQDNDLIATATRLARMALERARAKAALVNSEAQFRELAENIDDVFYNWDMASARHLYISPAYETLWQRSVQSLHDQPDSYLQAIYPHDLPAVMAAKREGALNKKISLQYRVVQRDGSLRWVRDHSYPVLDQDGVVQRRVGTARDITQQKLAALALASSHRALQMLSRSSLAVNRIRNEAGLLAEVCRVAVEVGGYRMAWVGYARNDASQRIEPMAHAGQENGYLDAIQISWQADTASGQGPAGKAIRSGLPQHRNDISSDAGFYWQTAALQRGYRSSIALPLRDANHSLGVLCLYRGDVESFHDDEIQLLQELADNLTFGIASLRSQEAARLAGVQLCEQASLLDHAQDAIMVRNLDQTLRFWNKGAERLYGWRADEVLGHNIGMLMCQHPQNPAANTDCTLCEEGDWHGELEQSARDGSRVEVESRCTVVRDERGQVNGVLSINTDIRERKRAREEILSLNASLEERVQRRTAQLEQANQQLEAFSYSVSHDLRGPLSAVDGFSALLEKNLEKQATEPLIGRNRHYLARIRAGVVQMGELIDALLSLAHISRSSLHWEPVNLSALANALLASYQEREPQRLTRLQIAPDLMVMGDSRLLRQLLDNLLSNAWKFASGQPCTDITLSQYTSAAGETVYAVRDNGAGFDMAYASKLFGAFQRLHSQVEFAGTGIGLATVARIITRHGGKIWAESVVGQGATFYFTLGAEAA